MCGIAGYLNIDSEAQADPVVINRMCRALVHRGPDDQGTHLDGPVAIGMRRLSIIDVEGGHQPISNESKTIWVVLNGEIYNYREIRASLQARGHVFTTASDTEIIPHLYEEMGEALVYQLRGMFAFALWDAERHMLLIARDRLGVKPLYYSFDGHTLVFGSE